MNYRLNKTALYVVLIVVLLAALVFGYTLVSAPTEIDSMPADSTLVDEESQNGGSTVTRSITAQQQYMDGIHTIAGTIALPTPCHRLLTEPFFIDEGRTQVEVRFTTLLEGDVCAQVVTDARFKISFEAVEDATISALYNGDPATLNLVPVEPGTDLSDFDIFIKG
jgi:hypothetical protein